MKHRWCRLEENKIQRWTRDGDPGMLSNHVASEGFSVDDGAVGVTGRDDEWMGVT